MQKLTLKKIDETNFLSAFGLKLREGQERFVSHPVRSLAQAYVYYHQCTPFGIFCDEQMVGYVMVIYDYDVPEYDVWHMMIDESQQGKGYGRELMQTAEAWAKAVGYQQLYLETHSNLKAAMKLYEKLGFHEIERPATVLHSTMDHFYLKKL